MMFPKYFAMDKLEVLASRISSEHSVPSLAVYFVTDDFAFVAAHSSTSTQVCRAVLNQRIAVDDIPSWRSLDEMRSPNEVAKCLAGWSQEAPRSAEAEQILRFIESEWVTVSEGVMRLLLLFGLELPEGGW